MQKRWIAKINCRETLAQRKVTKILLCEQCGLQYEYLSESLTAEISHLLVVYLEWTCLACGMSNWYNAIVWPFHHKTLVQPYCFLWFGLYHIQARGEGCLGIEQMNVGDYMRKLLMIGSVYKVSFLGVVLPSWLWYKLSACHILFYLQTYLNTDNYETFQPLGPNVLSAPSNMYLNFSVNSLLQLHMTLNVIMVDCRFLASAKLSTTSDKPVHHHLQPIPW